MRGFAMLVCFFCIVLASCAQRNENGFEPSVTVKGQYDAAFRVVK